MGLGSGKGTNLVAATLPRFTCYHCFVLHCGWLKLFGPGLALSSLPPAGQWAAAATLRGRGGVVLLQMYRSLLQTHLIRQFRR